MAPLDGAVEELASVAVRHLRGGDRVGLSISASRLRSWLEPDRGAAHGSALAGALASAASCIDADRSELDEVEVAQRVAEHARPLDLRGLSDLRRGDLDGLAVRADSLRVRAPFAPRLPFARTPREQSLRHYMAAFGIESPPCVEGERDRAETTLAQVLDRLATEKPRASVIHVWAPAPSRADSTAKAIAALRRHRIELRWSLPAYDAGLGAEGLRRSPVADAVDEAVRIRAHATRTRGERMLRRLGVRIIVRAAPRLVTREAAHAAEGAP
jgi:uncharacterized protein (DUF58 family)